MTAVKTSKKRAVMHSIPCTQDSAIQRLVTAIDGDGTTTGMKVEVALIKKHVDSIDANIGTIMSSLSAKTEIEAALEIERQVQARLALIDKEKKQEEGDKIDKKYAQRGDVRGLILVAVAILSLLINFYISAIQKKDKVQESTEIDG